MCCSECAAETADSSGSVNIDVVAEESCIGSDVPDADDHVSHATDVGSGDTAADDIQDAPTQPTVDFAVAAADFSSNTAQSGDDTETRTDAADALVKDDVGKLDDDVQPDSDGVDDKPTWYFADIKKQWRKFNIDLMPKVIRGYLIAVCCANCGRDICHEVLFALFLSTLFIGRLARVLLGAVVE